MRFDKIALPRAHGLVYAATDNGGDASVDGEGYAGGRFVPLAEREITDSLVDLLVGGAHESFREERASAQTRVFTKAIIYICR